MKYDFPFEVLHMAKLTIKLTCASFVRSSFAERKNRVAGNGSRMRRRLGFRFFHAHAFTNVPKGTESPNFHKTPIFAYALLADVPIPRSIKLLYFICEFILVI
jgi:hypothetical protein